MSAPEHHALTVFSTALERETGPDREACLDEACAGNANLRARVEALLRAHERAGEFLESAPATNDATQPENSAGEVPVGTATIEAVDPVLGVETRIGPYRPLESIGEGGMGTVYLAEQTSPVRRMVALKVIKAGMDSRQVIGRFNAERQALALMDHPNIAKVLDAGATDQGRPFFVMELVKGTPITRYCDEHRLTPKERLELFLPVCAAVQHAHQKGIIHRDLKPSNVLVGLYDGRPVPKIIDFGVAKAMGQKLTEQTLFTGFGTVVGTPEYMSPEQAQLENVDIDTRSDIYSLGVLLYELLTGTTPLHHKRVQEAAVLEVLRLIREEEPPKPSTRLGTTEELPSIAANRNLEPRKLTVLLHGDLDWIVMKALDKDRNRRYETASAFAADVQRYLADEPVQAGPPSALYRLKKFVRRNRGPVLAAGLVLLALVAGIVGTTWQAVRAEQRAEGERLAKQRAEANFALANEAVEKYLGTVTNNRKLKQADFHDLRKKLLESAIPFFQKLTEQKSDDPDVEAGRGRAFGRLAKVRSAMGENEATLQDFEAEHAIFARLTADFPTVPAYRHDLAISLNNLGHSLNHLGKREEAETAYRQAQGIYQKLAADFPAEPKYRQSLANNHNHLGILLDDLGQREEAEALYRKAVAIAEKLVTDFPSKSVYREELAGNQNNLGVLLSDLGKNEQAETAYRRSLDIRAKLAADFPAEPEYRQDLSHSQGNLGLLLAALGKPEEAAALLRQAVATKEKLRTDFPTVPGYRVELAECHINLSGVLDDLNKHEDAEEPLRQAVAILEQLADEFPTVPHYRRRLAAGHNNLGNLMKYLGKRGAAEAALRRALGIFEKLAADFPTVSAHAIELGGGYCNIGIWVRDGGQPETALNWYQKAIATLEPVVAKEPRLVDAREFLRNSHKGRAEALEDLGRLAEATRDWERALELDDGPSKEFLRANVAESRLRKSQKDKDAAGCLAAAADYEALKQTDAGELYNSACHRAICAAVIREDPKTPQADAPRLAKEQAELAMAWLHKAVAAGFADAAHMKKDEDIDALRGREDFQKLLADLLAKKK
jgi:serine/threonine protein kinase/tetratricopeptide (TPR) repeat protein